MNRRYIDTGQTITRGTAFPLVLTLPFDLTGWTVTFTMRASIADTGVPILQCTNEDASHMEVNEQTVTVTLADADTWKIPERAENVFIQLNLSQAGSHKATEIYSFAVLPNIMEVTP